MTFLELAQKIDEAQEKMEAAYTEFQTASAVLSEKERLYEERNRELSQLKSGLQTMLNGGAKPVDDMKAVALAAQKTRTPWPRP